MSAQQEPVVRVLDSIEQLKAVADTLRIQILIEAADAPRTVKQMAARLGVPQTRLYYHIKVLEQHGFIRVASRRMVSGIEERSYEATASSWNVSKELMAEVGKSGVLKSMFDLASTELDLALRTEGPPPGEPGSAILALTYTSFYLDEEEAAEVRRRIENLMLEFGSAPDPNKTEYHALFSFYKRVDATP